MSDSELAPKKPSSIEKWAATDAAASAIIEQEVVAREEKTARLRALRMAQPAVAPEKKRKTRRGAN